MTTLSVYYSFYIIAQPLAAQTSCGTIGHSSEVPYVRQDERLFYLNTDNPAACSGNVTSWRYCYYTPDVDFNPPSYQTPFAVYRNIDSVYQRVSDVFTLSVSSNEISRDGFACVTFPAEELTSIEEGDVIGTCVTNYDNFFPFLGNPPVRLFVVGQMSPFNTLHTASLSDIDCDNGRIFPGRFRLQMPDSVPLTVLTERPSKILHISAEISKSRISIIVL